MGRITTRWSIHHTCALVIGDYFSWPGHLSYLLKCSPTQNLGTPLVGSQNGPLKPPLTYFRWQVHNLEMLTSMDLPGMTTGSNMPFHNVDPKLVH
jgi:hypothetical protein